MDQSIKEAMEQAIANNIQFVLDKEECHIAYPVQVGDTIKSYYPIRVGVLDHRFSDDPGFVEAATKAAMMTETRCAYSCYWFVFLYEEDYAEWRKNAEKFKTSDYQGAYMRLENAKKSLRETKAKE